MAGQLTFIALRLFAIYLAIMSITTIFNYIPFVAFNSNPQDSYPYYVLVVGLGGFYAALASLFWLKASSLAASVMGSQTDSKYLDAGAGFAAAIFAATGILILAIVVPKLVSMVSEIIIFSHIYPENDTMADVIYVPPNRFRQMYLRLISAILQLLIGMALLIRPKEISGFLLKLRRAGHKK